MDTPEDLKKIPNSISVKNPFTNKQSFFRCVFSGQEYFCSRCQVKHSSQCPQRKAFYEAKIEKEKMISDGEILTKIYADSTLRKVDSLGLRADVCAMSGGGLGQIVQASLDDPFNIGQQHLVIMGGTNDKKTQNFPSTEMFAANVDQAMQKL